MLDRSGLVILLLCLIKVQSLYTWSHQQTLFVPSAAKTYGQTPALLTGRGFMTLVSGFDPVNPGLFVHTTEDGHLKNGHVVWSQQSKLLPPKDIVASDMFGRTMVSKDKTLIVAAPYKSRGQIFVYNGTRRHWSLVQTLVNVDNTDNDYFGESMSLHNNRLAISAKGETQFTGAVHVYERASGKLTWSRMAKLVPRDGAPGNYFAEKVSIHGDWVAATARNDNLGDALPSTLLTPEPDYRTGSGYLFSYSGTAWSQKQKIVATEFINFRKGGSFAEFIDKTLGPRFLGPDVELLDSTLAFGITNVKSNLTIRQPVWMWAPKASTGSWSLGQKLLSRHLNASGSEGYYRAQLTTDHQYSLIATLPGPQTTSSFLFRTFGSGWSLQQKLTAFDFNVSDPFVASDILRPFNSTKVNSSQAELWMARNFTSPALLGGYLIHGAGAHGGVQIRSQFRNDSCLRLWMSDHFLDGWDTAVLTVRAPDRSNDTFHPHCDQVDPFFVRYCPHQPSDEGVYIVKVFAASAARFYWEASWQVTIEATGETFRGDFSTKMEFNFNATSSSFSLFSIQNEVDLDAACFRCNRVAFMSWTDLQIPGISAFWPLVVTGAPYYISDYEGRSLTASGRVCDGITTFECYQTLTDGIYILRLGGGLFGRITGFPMSNASWHGCGEQGGLYDQLVFSINDGKCTPIQKFYYTGRCSVPPVITSQQYISGGVELTSAPSYGGTAKPTSHVFGTGKGSANARRQQHDNVDVLEGELYFDGSAMPSELPSAMPSAQQPPSLDVQDDSSSGDGFKLLGELMQSKRPSARPSFAPATHEVEPQEQPAESASETATTAVENGGVSSIYPEGAVSQSFLWATQGVRPEDHVAVLMEDPDSDLAFEAAVLFPEH